MTYARPCPQPDHAHALHLFQLIPGTPVRVEPVTTPPADDARLLFWAADAADIWAIYEGESLTRTGQHAVYAADLADVREPDRWALR